HGRRGARQGGHRAGNDPALDRTRGPGRSDRRPQARAQGGGSRRRGGAMNVTVARAPDGGLADAHEAAADTAYAYTGGKPFDATLPCVVFVHGAMNDHSVWTLAARWFA